MSLYRERRLERNQVDVAGGGRVRLRTEQSSEANLPTAKADLNGGAPGRAMTPGDGRAPHGSGECSVTGGPRRAIAMFNASIASLASSVRLPNPPRLLSTRPEPQPGRGNLPYVRGSMPSDTGACDMQLHARLLLQLVNHRKQIARLGIAIWTKHTHQALRRRSGGGA